MRSDVGFSYQFNRYLTVTKCI